MKTQLGAMLLACTAFLLSAPLAEASVKNKIFSINGSFAAGPVFQQFNGATLSTTTTTFSVSGGGIPITVSGVITSEQDFPSANLAIANATASFPGIGSGSATAIQIGTQVIVFGTANGSFGGFPVFAFFFGSGQQVGAP